MKIARNHTTPTKDYDKFVRSPEGTVAWQQENRRVLVAHLPNWFGRNPLTAPKILAFVAVYGRTYMGTFTSVEDAVGVLLVLH